jgi:hypothetical protein
MRRHIRLILIMKMFLPIAFLTHQDFIVKAIQLVAKGAIIHCRQPMPFQNRLIVMGIQINFVALGLKGFILLPYIIASCASNVITKNPLPKPIALPSGN